MRTYCYGARAPIHNADLVSEQMLLAHKYRNALTEVEIKRRKATDPILAPYRAAQLKLWRAWKAVKPKKPKEGEDLVAWEKATAEWNKAKPKKWVVTPEDQEKIDAVNAAASAARKEAEHASGVYWGTYLAVEHADQQARTAKRKFKWQLKEGSDEFEGAPSLPKFHSFDGHGMVGMHIQGKPLTVPELLAGTDLRVRIVAGTHPGKGPRPGPAREREHRQLHLRVGSDGVKPIWAVFPFIYHRDLPAHALVNWVRVMRYRVATHVKYEVQFVLEGPAMNPLPTAAKGAVAIDVGWRKFEDEGLRVATWVDDTGERGELRLPQRLRDRNSKVNSLESIRDTSFNEILAWLVAQRNDCWPEWLLDATKTMSLWEAQRQLAGLFLRWRRERRDASGVLAEVYRRLEAWYAQDKHLYEWADNQRKNVLNARLETYRVFAVRMAKYRRVVMEQLDLRRFARKKEEDGYAIKKSRGRRFDAALSELMYCIEDAVARAGGACTFVPPGVTESNPGGSTQTCFVCGEPEPFDAARHVEHQCKCGAAWDQDFNAARNLLRAARCGEGVASRSRVKALVPKGESKIALRRKAGKLRKKLDRSPPVP